MSLPINDIELFCAADLMTNPGGLRKIVITEVGNITGNIVGPGADLYEIGFAPGTASYSDQDVDSDQGQYTDQTVTAFVAGKRATMELLRRRLRDRRVAIQVTDANGDTHLISSALLTVSYQTGSERSDSNGYEITASGVTLYRTTADDLIIDVGITGGENEGGGSDFSTDPSPGGGGGGGSTEDYYIKVVTTMLGYIPTASNNPVDVRNRFVTASDGSRWAIDIDGKGILLRAARGSQTEVIGATTTEITLTPPASTAIDPQNMVVSRNGVILEYDHQDINGYTLDVGQSKLLAPTVWPFEAGERINIFYM